MNALLWAEFCLWTLLCVMAGIVAGRWFERLKNHDLLPKEDQ